MNYLEFGDCRAIMEKWKVAGVKAQTCVTSPPYYGLRDYQVEGQIGLEPTPNEYIASLVSVFRCVKDILADDGTLWLNIGDSYARSAGDDSTKSTDSSLRTGRTGKSGELFKAGNNRPPNGLKAKDLIGIPWMLAFALRADGWYLRQEIIWAKSNPMPESVKDRCTKAHESIFLLSKRPKYYFDAEAISEPSVTGDIRRPYGSKGANMLDARGACAQGNGKVRTEFVDTRNKRSVWTVSTKPYKGAHFATFPPDLIEPCILAGSRPGDTVLDPFMGSGTTAMVAAKHGRQYLGCELNEDYRVLQEQRILSVLL